MSENKIVDEIILEEKDLEKGDLDLSMTLKRAFLQIKNDSLLIYVIDNDFSGDKIKLGIKQIISLEGLRTERPTFQELFVSDLELGEVKTQLEINKEKGDKD